LKYHRCGWTSMAASAITCFSPRSRSASAFASASRPIKAESRQTHPCSTTRRRITAARSVCWWPAWKTSTSAPFNGHRIPGLDRPRLYRGQAVAQQSRPCSGDSRSALREPVRPAGRARGRHPSCRAPRRHRNENGVRVRGRFHTPAQRVGGQSGRVALSPARLSPLSR
jgi:hypothetical protein